MTNEPSISVVIPCYNAADFLGKAIESVINQTFRPIEIIVIDDGSTDESVTIANSFGSSVRVVRQENQGPSVARNRGFDEATGDWIAFLDADDIWLPTKLQEQIALLDSNVVCVHTAYFWFGTRRRVINRSNIPPSRRYSVTFLAVNAIMNSSSVLIRSSVGTRFPTWTSQAEDMIFFLDLSREGRIRMVTNPVVGYRKHGTSLTARHDREILWHKSLMRWLAESSFGDEIRDRITRGWHDRLIVASIILLLRGYPEDCRRLLSYVGTLGVDWLSFLLAPFRVLVERCWYRCLPQRSG